MTCVVQEKSRHEELLSRVGQKREEEELAWSDDEDEETKEGEVTKEEGEGETKEGEGGTNEEGGSEEVTEAKKEEAVSCGEPGEEQSVEEDTVRDTVQVPVVASRLSCCLLPTVINSDSTITDCYLKLVDNDSNGVPNPIDFR